MSDNFASTKYPTARVPHTCHECRRTIGRRERYARTAGSWEGYFFTNIACLHCAIARIIVDFEDDYYNEGYYGGLGEWCGWYEGDSVRMLRIVAGFNNRWALRYSAGLMPLPATPRVVSEYVTRAITEARGPFAEATS